jgi:hypothetical protein
LNERYRDDPSTHPNIDPDLWLEAGSFDGPYKNQVCRLSNTTTENLWMTHSTSIVECPYSIPSVQTSEFITMLDQRVQDRMTQLNDKYEGLTADYE